ncbi:MAG: GxxExxY protein [Candidatus Edwardsbacteria bacterium]|nr:GxxExxY protein [Candidatus Edwardsbacteria bacterium]
MKLDSQNYKYSELTDKILKAFYKVYNALGYGFLEKVYENAMMIELKSEGLEATFQSPIKVIYDNQTIGEYFADILVENKVIVEIKAGKCFALEHEAQLLNYLKATEIEVGLLLNFGIKPEIKRKAFNNPRKNQRQSA